jgi:hypothetical protein
LSGDLMPDVRIVNGAEQATVKTDGTDVALAVHMNTIPAVTATVTGTVDVSTLPAITGTVAIDQGTPGTTNKVVVEIVTPTGITCEDETNTAVLVGVKGSVAYDNFNNVFYNQIYGQDPATAVPQKYSAVNIQGAVPSAWGEYLMPIAAMSDTTNYWYPLYSDENSLALRTNLVDTTGRKMVYLPMDDSNIFAWTENGIGGYTVSDITYYTRPFMSDEVTHALLVQPVSNNGIKQNFSTDGEAVTIDIAHHEIHMGDSFSGYYIRTTAATSGHRSGIYIKTPATTPLVHMVISCATSAAADYSLCEAPTIAANTGTHSNVILNRYRDSATTSGCFDNATSAAVNNYTTLTEAQIAGDGTWATGTVLRQGPLGVGKEDKAVGGSSRDTQEWILMANTAYVFLITNTSATATVHSIFIDWYEY